MPSSLPACLGIHKSFTSLSYFLLMRRAVRALVAVFALAAGAASSQGMMGPGWGGGFPGWGMMGNWWDYRPPGSAKALTIDQAVQDVQDYLKSAWGPELELAEVMEFDNQFYAAAREKSTGIYAFELLVNKWTGAILPEPGPNMMWNAKYGHMGGMMGGGGGWGWGGRQGYRSGPSFDAGNRMPVTPERARQLAQQFLDEQLPGVKVEQDVDTFYGYYTMDVMKDGKVYGMLSVNGFNGWVWYHTWHGKFIQEKDLE
jgi:hypothetical protein